MNRIKLYILRFVAGISLCIIGVSCSQDDIGINKDGEFLSGEFPLKFTASVDEMTTRAEETEFWTDGDPIRVCIGETVGNYYPWTGKYLLNPNGYVKEAEEALAWPYQQGYVTAWFPYFGKSSEVTEVSINDQSKGNHFFDFMTAGTENAVNYNDIVNLKFKHLMSKVRCKLIKGEGVTDEDLETAEVSYYGLTKVKFSEDGLSCDTGSWSWITPTSDFMALLFPQDMSEKPFIEVKLTVKVNDVSIDKTLTYTPKPGEVDLKAGSAYNFTLTVQKDRLVAQTITGQWNDKKGGEYADGVPRRVNLKFPAENVPELSFSENVTPMPGETRAGDFPDYLIVKGREFTISYEVNDENAMMGIIPLIDDADKVKMNCLRIDNVYTFTYKLLSDDTVNLEYTEYAGVGDFYYSDGTWSRGLTEGKTPIGVVFRSGAAGTASAKNRYGVDTPENYDWDHPIRGYVVALNDASTSKGYWGGLARNNYPPYFIINYDKDENQPENTRYSGYLNTQAIRTDVKKLGSDTIYNNTNVNEISKYKDNFWSFKVACEYRPSNLTDDKIPSAPPTSSGWYLPSISQLNDIAECFPLKYCILEAKGTAFDALGVEYWSSSEAANTATQATVAHTMNIATRNKFTRQKLNYTDYVRSVLTF